MCRQPDAVGRAAVGHLHPGGDVVGLADLERLGEVVLDAVTLVVALGDDRGLLAAVGLGVRDVDDGVAAGVTARGPALEAVLEVELHADALERRGHDEVVDDDRDRGVLLRVRADAGVDLGLHGVGVGRDRPRRGDGLPLVGERELRATDRRVPGLEDELHGAVLGVERRRRLVDLRAEGEGVLDARLEHAGRGLDAVEARGADEAQRLAAVAVVDVGGVGGGDAAARQPRLEGLVVEVEVPDRLRGGGRHDLERRELEVVDLVGVRARGAAGQRVAADVELGRRCVRGGGQGPRPGQRRPGVRRDGAVADPRVAGVGPVVADDAHARGAGGAGRQADVGAHAVLDTGRQVARRGLDTLVVVDAVRDVEHEVFTGAVVDDRERGVGAALDERREGAVFEVDGDDDGVSRRRREGHHGGREARCCSC